MTDKDKKPKKQPKQPKIEDLSQRIDELTADLQRTRADFENYRKRVEAEKQQARQAGRSGAVLQLLPVIDNIERAAGYLPAELKGNKWAEGVVALDKQLHGQLEKLGVKRIEAQPGTEFNPELHEAVQFDEDSSGDKEVIMAELQAGYTLDGMVIRHTMVKVGRQ